MERRFYCFKRNRILLVSMVIAVLGLFCSGNTLSLAGNIITNGTTLNVSSGTSLVSAENLVVASGATLNNSGTLILKKDLVNENTSPSSLGSGTVEFSGTTAQMITGQNVFQALSVNNASGVTLGGNTGVNGTLTLMSGKVTVASYNLNLGPSAIIAGTPSASAMIVVTGSGELRKEFPTSFTGSFTYPVGDATGTSEYSPVTLVFLSGTFAAGNYAGVSLVNDKYPNDTITGNYLTRYWTITKSGITAFTCNATFQYVAADVTGTESLISCTRVDPLPWITYSLTNAGTHQLTANGIATFSSFTGLKSASVPSNQELVNITIPNGVSNCYDAIHVLTVAGSGTTFVVESGGNVTLIAGEKISLLPGVKVYSGGYLLAKITTTGGFCNTLLNPLVLNPDNADIQLLSLDPPLESQFIKIYPNPTTDLVILELTQPDPSRMMIVNIYNMNGKAILQKLLPQVYKHAFTLSGQPTGIYIIQVRSDERSQIAKIVKN